MLRWEKRAQRGAREFKVRWDANVKRVIRCYNGVKRNDGNGKKCDRGSVVCEMSGKVPEE